MIATASRSRPRGSVLRILESLPRLPHPAAGGLVLFIAVGLPGTGKSSFCRRLVPRIDAVRLDSDTLRHVLYQPPAYSPEESAALFRAIHTAARRLLEQGASVIIDATNLAEAHRRPLYQVAEATRARIALALFTAPETVISERLARRQSRPDPGDRSNAGIEIYNRMRPGFEPVTRPHWTIDTSDAAGVDAALDSISRFCLGNDPVEAKTRQREQARSEGRS